MTNEELYKYFFNYNLKNDTAKIIIIYFLG